MGRIRVAIREGSLPQLREQVLERTERRHDPPEGVERNG